MTLSAGESEFQANRLLQMSDERCLQFFEVTSVDPVVNKAAWSADYCAIIFQLDRFERAEKSGEYRLWHLVCHIVQNSFPSGLEAYSIFVFVERVLV